MFYIDHLPEALLIRSAFSASDASITDCLVPSATFIAACL